MTFWRELQIEVIQRIRWIVLGGIVGFFFGATIGTAIVYLASPAKASSTVTTTVYNTSGVEQSSEHIVMGKATLAAGTVTVTLTGKAVFTSSSSYVCPLVDSTGLNLTAVSYTSGSQFVITGVLTDQVSFVCIGN
jgi:hypothetical protein